MKKQVEALESEGSGRSGEVGYLGAFVEGELDPKHVARRTFRLTYLVSSRNELVFVFQFRGIRSACWWHNAVLAQINHHLAVVVRHVPNAHNTQA
jgi:hypothetical protein